MNECKPLALGTGSPASLKLFLNLGAALLANGKLEDARGVYMAGCGVCPCASTWLGAGKAMLRAGDLDGAEAGRVFRVCNRPTLNLLLLQRLHKHAR